MTGRYKYIFGIILICLSVLPLALRAQGYQIADELPYHASSVYYVTLQDAAGENINSQYAAADGAIGAFVGDALRGTSQWLSTGNEAGQGFFVIRVWGDKNDEPTATFRLRSSGLEYQIASQPFAQGLEGTYGNPGAPLAFTVAPVTGIALPFASLTLEEEETASTVPTLLPANHSQLLTALSYAYSSSNADAFTVSADGLLTAVHEGEGKVTVTATPGNFAAEATVRVVAKNTPVPDVTMSFASPALNASKLRDVELTLTKDDTADFRPGKVELVFGKAANGEPAATATMADNTGLKWNVRGQYVGSYTIKIKYNDKEQAATCQVNIPAEYSLDKGWTWVSFYAIQGGSLLLKSGDKWAAVNKNLTEIRSQSALLYNDPELGLFGDIERLTPTDGMYKVYCQSALVLSAGYQNLSYASTMSLPRVKKGYTWVTYPHEKDHSFDVVGPYLARNAQRGDLIIGKDFFAEYDGDQWEHSPLFRLEAGKGYIYYTEGQGGQTLNWGPATLPSEAPAVAQSRVAEADDAATPVTPWHHAPADHAETMPVVAVISGIDSQQDYAVGAFVGDECRGIGHLLPSGRIHIAVAGKMGETVTFRLYHHATGLSADVPQKLSFTRKAGSYQRPVTLDAHDIAIGETAVGSQAGGAAYDLMGRRINASSPLTKGIYITTDAQGRMIKRISK